MDARLGGILSAALKARPMTGAAGEVVRVFAPSGKGVAGVFLYGTTPPGQTARAQQSGNAGAKKDAKLYPKKPPPAHAEMSPALAAEKAGGALYAAHGRRQGLRAVARCPRSRRRSLHRRGRAAPLVALLAAHGAQGLQA